VKKSAKSHSSFKDRANDTHGSVSFEELGKLIGKRWRRILSQGIQKYHNLAQEDTLRYKREMSQYYEEGHVAPC